MPYEKTAFRIISIIIILISLYILFGCKAKQVQCEAYSKSSIKSDSLLFNLSEFQKKDTIYDDSWQDEDWFEDDRLAQIDDTTFYILLGNGEWVLIDSL